MALTIAILLVVVAAIGLAFTRGKKPEAIDTTSPPRPVQQPAWRRLPSEHALRSLDDRLHIEQDPDFPLYRWVRTTLFDGETPYIGFTYRDRMKGNCIKGENVAGMSEAAIKAKLQAKFPSSTMAPIPAGHRVTPLTAAEIATYELPAEPDWVQIYR